MNAATPGPEVRAAPHDSDVVGGAGGADAAVEMVSLYQKQKGPSSFRVEPNSQNRGSSSSPGGMWAGCI